MIIRIKKAISILLSVLLMCSMLPLGVLAEPLFSSEDTIDYSHEQLAGNGYTFGVKNNEIRYQTFTAPKSGAVAAIEVVLLKKNAATTATPDVTAYIYSVGEDGKPLAALSQVTLKGEKISSATPGTVVSEEMISRFEFAYSLEKDKKYAIVLESAVVGADAGTDQCYDWFTKKDVAASEYFGKTSGESWVDESFLGTGWLKVYYQTTSSDVIDYSFDSTANGFGFGATGNEYRFQTFTAPKTGEMDSFDIKVTKFANNAESGLEGVEDLIVELYSVEAGLPKDRLASTTVAADSIESKSEKKVPLSFNLEAGKQYALAMSMKPLSKHGGYDCYGWATGTVAGASGEKFGKTNTTSDPDYDEDNYNWLHENLGTGWMRVNYKGTVNPSTPTRIEASIASNLLDIGENAQIDVVVKDQFGEVINDAVIGFVSSSVGVATVSGTGLVNAVSGGNSTITITAGSLTEKIIVSVKNSDGTVIPVPGLIIDQDIKFTPGTYNFAGAANGLIIKGSNITVDGNGAVIQNADPASILPDTTSGAYAYDVNLVDGQDKYYITRKIDLSKASTSKITFDAKGENFSGAMVVYASENGADWTALKKSTTLSGWENFEISLNAYAGKTVFIRIGYEKDGTTPASNIKILLDTIEVYENSVRTFSDLAEAKIFYWWDVSYGDGVRVADNMGNASEGQLVRKPFDRTSYTIDKRLFKGTGLFADGVDNVIIKNLDLSGFYWGMSLRNSTNVTVENNNLSNNFTDPNQSWGDQEGGGLEMRGVSNSTVKNNISNNNANGLILRDSDNNSIFGNDFSINSDVCLEMHTSSFNDIKDNDFSWGIRIDAYQEVHARDSTSQLMESGSNYNLFKNNDFTHGGDGIFIRVLNGWSCEGNVFDGNDASYANNNAVESWAGRNYYYNNKANHSSYGFWLGGSDESVLIGNEAAYNGITPHNAPEAFGNAGIAIVNGTGEHIKIIDNDIHDNYGPGIALRFKDVYPTHHYVIANNRITNNKTSEYSSSHKGYPIYLDQGDWFDITGNLMEGNDENYVYKSKTATNVFERASTYYENYEDYKKHAPTAKLISDKKSFVVGEEVTFTAEATDPQGKSLFYRWDMGDGIILTGKTIKYTFDKTGYYDVAYTVTDEEGHSDLAWLNCNVVSAGEEIGTESDVSNWLIPDRSGKTLASTETRTPAPATEFLDYDVYYVVDGTKSIKIDSTSGPNTMTYPKDKNANYDFSGDGALSFSMKVQNKGNDWASYKTPVVKLYTDANNYITYTPTKSWLSPVYAADYLCGQYRSDWIPLMIPFDGNNEWVVSSKGTVDFSNINYIELDVTTGGVGLHLWVDGLKTISKADAPYYSANLFLDGTASVSSSANEANNSVPIGGTDFNKFWESEVAAQSSYEVNLGTKRYIDRTDLLFHYSPTGDPSKDIINLPKSYKIEYLENGVWKEVETEKYPSVKPKENSVSFSRVLTDKIRVNFTHEESSSVALYGIRGFNTTNVAAEQTASGSNNTNVISNIVKDAVLESVDMLVAINDTAHWPARYGNFEAYVFEASVDGKGPAGEALAKGVIMRSEIEATGINKIYNIPMTSLTGGDVILKAGKQYVLLATQDPIMPHDENDPGSNKHYRWPTSSALGVVGEQYGKVTYKITGAISGYSPENLGVGYLKIHTDKDVGDKATIDYTWANPTGGFGVGHQGEENRYQTFTMPIDSVNAVIDGQVNNDDIWSTEGAGKVNSVVMTFDGEKTIDNVNLFFEDGHVPDKLIIKSGDTEVKTVTDLVSGFNNIDIGIQTTSKLEFVFTDGESFTALKEIEVMDGYEDVLIPEVDKDALRKLVDSSNAILLFEEYYTEDSFATFKNALDKAKTVLLDESASQADVNEAVSSLEAAIIALEPAGEPIDKEELAEIITSAENLLETLREYLTDESILSIENAIDKAKVVLLDDDATQEDIYKAVEDMVTAFFEAEYKFAIVYLIDDETGLEIIATTKEIPEDTELDVILYKAGDRYNAVKKLLKDKDKFELYDIELFNGAGKVTPSGNVAVSMIIPDSYNADTLAIYGVVDGELVLFDSVILNDRIMFETDHFSEYVLVDLSSTAEPTIPTDTTKTTKPTKPSPPTGESWFQFVMILAALFVAAAVLFVLKKKEKRA